MPSKMTKWESMSYFTTLFFKELTGTFGGFCARVIISQRRTSLLNRIAEKHIMLGVLPLKWHPLARASIKGIGAEMSRG
jgi:hypothetical protein